MINLYRATIEELCLHYVGNKSREEDLFLSKSSHRLSQDLVSQLHSYFFKPFIGKEEVYYQFHHEVDLELNEVYRYAKEVFQNHNSFCQNSKNIAKHLYNQSNHPHIKNGELYVSLLENCELDNRLVQAIGIFKSEMKDDFFQFHQREENLNIQSQKGVNIKKLDKACIIFNIDSQEGFKVFTLDTNRYDTRYWTDYFLNLTPCQDKNFQTKSFLKLCEDFSKDVIFAQDDKREQIKFLNKSLDFFAKKDEFKQEDFLETVVNTPEQKQEFTDYKRRFIENYKIDDFVDFEIANNVVTGMQRKFKNIIDLDTNVQIRMKFKDERSVEKYIEKGWDEEREMYYYLIYFNEEKR